MVFNIKTNDLGATLFEETSVVIVFEKHRTNFISTVVYFNMHLPMAHGADLSSSQPWHMKLIS